MLQHGLSPERLEVDPILTQVSKSVQESGPEALEHGRPASEKNLV